MVNAHKGQVSLKLGRRNVVVAYDWNALATLRNELGADYLDALANAADTTDLDVLAKALSIGLEKHQPGDYPAERIAEMSPPIVRVVGAINQALNAANWGADGPPETDDTPAEAGGVNPPETWLRRLFGLPAKPASSLNGSGG